MKIRDIARLAGVSVATVSRVLNHPQMVREETRRRVLEVIDRLGYEPNIVARSLRTRKTGNLAMVISTESGSVFESPYFGLLMRGITTAAERREYHLIFSTCHLDDSSTFESFLRKSLVDGFIVADVQDFDPRIEILSEEKPFIVIGRPLSNVGYKYVDSDNEGGTYEATKYLLETGHERIAFINGPKRMSVSRHRFEGYRKAHEALERKVDSSLVFEGRFTEEDGYRLTEKAIEEGVDAILYSGDVMAFGGMRALRDAGLEPGKDISIVGFDDVTASSLLGLSSVRQPIEEIGEKAAELLIDMIEGKEVRSEVFPTELIIRKSIRDGEDEGS